MKKTLWICPFLLCIHIALAQVNPSQEEIQIKGRSLSKSNLSQLWKNQDLTGVFLGNIDLAVPLVEVVLLVILVNVFALFKKARLILAASYLFCFKWVFWSNYTDLLNRSSKAAVTSSCIFVFCGILSAILFCLDRFNSND